MGGTESEYPVDFASAREKEPIIFAPTEYGRLTYNLKKHIAHSPLTTRDVLLDEKSGLLLELLIPDTLNVVTYKEIYEKWEIPEHKKYHIDFISNLNRKLSDSRDQKLIHNVPLTGYTLYRTYSQQDAQIIVAYMLKDNEYSKRYGENNNAFPFRIHKKNNGLISVLGERRNQLILAKDDDTRIVELTTLERIVLWNLMENPDFLYSIKQLAKPLYKNDKEQFVDSEGYVSRIIIPSIKAKTRDVTENFNMKDEEYISNRTRWGYTLVDSGNFHMLP